MEIVKIETGQLEEVVKNSGLAIQEGEEIKQSYQPFLVQLAEIQGQAGKIDFDNPTSTDEMIARELRLKTVKIRTGASDLKDNRKRTYLLRGNLEQAAYNLIAASCKLTEDVFVNVEKAREIAEAKRRAELKLIRDAEMLPLAEFVPAGLDYGKMTEEDYQKILTSAKMQLKIKQDAEAKAEEERRAAELARIAEEKRIREENERLRKEAEEKERQMAAEREKAEKERKIAEEKARKEREAIEAKAEAERKAAEEKAAQERKEAEERLRAERVAREKAEAEIRAKAEAERKAEAARLLAEKKAQSAPDRQKLVSLSLSILAVQFPEMKTIEGMAVLNSVKELLKKTTDYITKKVEEL